jgi:acyl carrier protein
MSSQPRRCGNLVDPVGDERGVMGEAMSEVKEAIRAYLVEEALDGRPEGDLQEHTNLVEEDILDSLGIFSIIEFLEERFDIQVDPAEVVFDNFETMDAIERLVTTKLQESPAAP